MAAALVRIKTMNTLTELINARSAFLASIGVRACSEDEKKIIDLLNKKILFLLDHVMTTNQ
jgi:hypothetical protein